MHERGVLHPRVPRVNSLCERLGGDRLVLPAGSADIAVTLPESDDASITSAAEVEEIGSVRAAVVRRLYAFEPIDLGGDWFGCVGLDANARDTRDRAEPRSGS